MKLRIPIVGALMANLLVFGMNPGQSHSAENYYPDTWPNPPIEWKFAPTFPNGPKRARVQDAAEHWNAVTGVGFSFSFQGEGNQAFDPDTGCNRPYNGVFEQVYEPYGGTYPCFKQNGNLDSMTLIMEEGSDSFWKTGPDDTGTHVYESVVTHEMGHFTGFGAGYRWPGGSDLLHFVPSSQPSGICWDDSTRHTMCGGLEPVDGRNITLEEHDIETFQNGY